MKKSEVRAMVTVYISVTLISVTVGYYILWGNEYLSLGDSLQSAVISSPDKDAISQGDVEQETVAVGDSNVWDDCDVQSCYDELRYNLDDSKVEPPLNKYSEASISGLILAPREYDCEVHIQARPIGAAFSDANITRVSAYWVNRRASFAVVGVEEGRSYEVSLLMNSVRVAKVVAVGGDSDVVLHVPCQHTFQITGFVRCYDGTWPSKLDLSILQLSHGHTFHFESGINEQLSPATSFNYYAGHFHATVPFGGKMEIRAFSPGFSVEPVRVIVDMRATSHVELVLHQSYCISVQVAGLRNDPVANATVKVAHVGSGLRRSWLPPGDTTDERGYVSIPNICTRFVLLVVSKDGHVTARKRVDVSESSFFLVDLHLAGASLSGVLTTRANGKRLEHAHVRVFDDDARVSFGDTYCCGEGHFELHGLPSRPILLEVTLIDQYNSRLEVYQIAVKLDMGANAIVRELKSDQIIWVRNLDLGD